MLYKLGFAIYPDKSIHKIEYLVFCHRFSRYDCFSKYIGSLISNFPVVPIGKLQYSRVIQNFLAVPVGKLQYRSLEKEKIMLLKKNADNFEAKHKTQKTNKQTKT